MSAADQSPDAQPWVVARVSVSQGGVDYVSVRARFATEAEAEAALADYPGERGHAWSGLELHRVLQQWPEGFRLADGTPYPPGGMGF